MAFGYFSMAQCQLWASQVTVELVVPENRKSRSSQYSTPDISEVITTKSSMDTLTFPLYYSILVNGVFSWWWMTYIWASSVVVLLVREVRVKYKLQKNGFYSSTLNFSFWLCNNFLPTHCENTVCNTHSKKTDIASSYYSMCHWQP